MPDKPSCKVLAQPIETLKQHNDPLSHYYCAIIDNSMDAILLASTDCKIFFANQAACELFQMTEQDIIDGGCLAIVDVQDPRLPLAIKERTRTGKFRGDLNFKKKDGTIFPGEISASIFNNADGKEMTSISIRDSTDRRLLEQKIERSKILLERVYSSLNEAVFVVDPKTRVIISCNDAAEKIFGYPKAEMLGQNTEFIHINKKRYHEFGKKVSQVMETRNMLQMDFNMKKKDGTVFPTEHTVKNVRDNTGLPVINVSVVRDISFQKTAADSIQAKQAELKIKAERLKELNSALKVLLEQRDHEKKNIEAQLSESINGFILPYMDRIRELGINDLQNEYIKILESNLKEITKPYNHRQSGELRSLTPSELRIANLVKQGYRIKEIALKLNISPRTVEFHRDNTRAKLGIKGKKINLKTFLSNLL